MMVASIYMFLKGGTEIPTKILRNLTNAKPSIENRFDWKQI